MKYLYYEEIENNKAEVVVISDTLIFGLENYVEYDGELEDGQAIFIDLNNNSIIYEDIKKNKTQLDITNERIDTLDEALSEFMMLIAMEQEMEGGEI